VAGSSPEVGALQETLLAAVSGLGRIVPRAVSDAAAAMAPCRMLALARESTFRRRPTSMLGVVGTLM